MATFFGEVLPLLSRAVDEEEDEDVPLGCKISVNPSETWSSGRLLEVKVAVVAVGPEATAFVEAVVDTTAVDVVAMVCTCSVQEDSNLSTTEGGKLGQLIFDPTSSALFCLLPETLQQEHAAPLAYMVFERIVGGRQLAAVTVLTVNHLSAFKTTGIVEEPILRMLPTSCSAKDALLWPLLEQPNTVAGLAAAVVTECEVRNIPATLYVCYCSLSDAQDSLIAASSFLPLLAMAPFSRYTKPRADVERQLHRMVLKRTKDRGNVFV